MYYITGLLSSLIATGARLSAFFPGAENMSKYLVVAKMDSRPTLKEWMLVTPYVQR